MTVFNKTAIMAVFMFAAVHARSQTAQAPQQHALSVQQAVDFAMKNSVQVRNALTDIQIQKQTNREITSAALPQINASGSVTDYLDIPTSLIPAAFTGGPAGTFQAIQFGTKYNSTGGIDVSQLLFDGQVFIGLQARASSIRFYERQADVTKEQINANVRKIYYQLLIGNQQMGSIDANIARFDSLLRDTREIYKNGFAEKLDVDKVSVQLSNLQTEKLRIQNQLTAGNNGLKFLLNMSQSDVLILTDSVTEDELKSNLLDAPADYKNRKEYQLLQEAIQLGQFNIRRYKLSALPTVAAFGSYSKNAQRTEFDFFKGGQWFTTSLIGLRLNFPIFSGFARKARVEKATLELQKVKNNVEQLQASIDNEVATARLNIASALLTIDNQKRNMVLAESVYNATKLKYEQGLGSNQEIYNAQTELRVAQNNYYGALYDAIIARIDYQRATGTL
jgi:outer membrane protein TolC